MKNLETKINTIGEQMVHCKQACRDICNKPNKGIIPRCLILDNLESKDPGCAIVGINPGKYTKTKDEEGYYLKHGIHYESVKDFWNLYGRSHKYYRFLTDFKNCLGINGPVLWTELVKCQNSENSNTLPLQTFRTCTSEFLSQEIDALPDHWPLIAVGREAHKALSYMYPKKTVIGVPHPTSSRGYFAGLFENAERKKLKPKHNKVLDIIKLNKRDEIWLSGVSQKQ